MEAVHAAARQNNVEKLRRLLEEDPRRIDAGKPKTPLWYAAKEGSVDAVRLLLDRGADMGQGEEGNNIPLMMACCCGYLDVVSLLIERGSDPSVNRCDQSALIRASYGDERPGSDHVGVIRLLIKDGRVPVNARDDSGCTALWWACDLGYTSRARVLLIEGFADHTIADNHGYTCGSSAEDCEKLLRVCGGALCSHMGEGGLDFDLRFLGSGGYSYKLVYYCGRDAADAADAVADACGAAVGRGGGGGGGGVAWQWYEGELEKALLLSKARAVVDATYSITKVCEKAQARTRAKARRAREEAAPAWLRGRVERGEALPVVDMAEQAGQDGEDEEVRAVCEFMVWGLAEDLYVEVMEAVRYPGWAPEGEDDWIGPSGHEFDEDQDMEEEMMAMMFEEDDDDGGDDDDEEEEEDEDEDEGEGV